MVLEIQEKGARSPRRHVSRLIFTPNTGDICPVRYVSIATSNMSMYRCNRRTPGCWVLLSAAGKRNIPSITFPPGGAHRPGLTGGEGTPGTRCPNAKSTRAARYRTLPAATDLAVSVAQSHGGLSAVLWNELSPSPRCPGSHTLTHREIDSYRFAPGSARRLLLQRQIGVCC